MSQTCKRICEGWRKVKSDAEGLCNDTSWVYLSVVVVVVVAQGTHNKSPRICSDSLVQQSATLAVIVGDQPPASQTTAGLS